MARESNRPWPSPSFPPGPRPVKDIIIPVSRTSRLCGVSATFALDGPKHSLAMHGGKTFHRRHKPLHGWLCGPVQTQLVRLDHQTRTRIGGRGQIARVFRVRAWDLGDGLPLQILCDFGVYEVFWDSGLGDWAGVGARELGLGLFSGVLVNLFGVAGGMTVIVVFLDSIFFVEVEYGATFFFSARVGLWYEGRLVDRFFVWNR